jgi:hypothetical protein
MTVRVKVIWAFALATTVGLALGEGVQELLSPNQVCLPF